MSVALPTEFLQYLAKHGRVPGTRVPPIQELAQILGISTGKLREQLEVARQLGLVEVKPKTGIRTSSFSFSQSLQVAMRFALAIDQNYFYQFGVLRNHVEASFWYEAVQQLRLEDKVHLERLLDDAWSKLHGSPTRIPHKEHRDLHLTIFCRLENPFVVGLLETYWDAYEVVGLNLFAEYAYLETVWNYHQEMVRAVLRGDLEAGYKALVEHTGLLQNRPEAGRYPSPVPLVDGAFGD